MPTFIYTAMDSHGKSYQGRQEAKSAAEAESNLQSMGYIFIQCTPESKASTSRGSEKPGRKMLHFALIWTLFSLGFASFFVGYPAFQIMKARSWVATECEIISSH